MVIRKEYDVNKATEEIVAIFGPLTDEQRIHLAENIELRTYNKGEILYEEFDTPQYMMCLLHGKVMIAKNGIGNRSQITDLSMRKVFSATARHLQMRNIGHRLRHTRNHWWL